MNDLRKAAEMALEALEYYRSFEDCQPTPASKTIPALRQALDDKPPVKTYAGGKPNYCTTEEKDNVGACVTCGAPKGEWLVDAVNMTQERVDETAKDRLVRIMGTFDLATGHADTLDQALDALEEELRDVLGHLRARQQQEPFIYVREDNEKPFGGYEHCSEADPGAFPVYTAPPKREWVGLTDDEVIECFDSVAFGQVEDDLIINKHVNIFRAIHSIEAKLKEKNS